MLAVVAATASLAPTVAAIVARPRGLGEGWSATLGAAAMLLTRLATPGDLLAVVREVAGVLLFLLSMMVLTAAAERGSGRGLYAGLFLLGAAVTALLSLDVTVLVLTPIVHTLAVRLRLKPLPYLFICTFVANTGSLLLPISNLTNLLVYGLLGLGFAGFARAMLLPQLAALAANLAVLALLFRRDIPRRFDPAPLRADPPVDDPAYLRAATLVLGATLVALVVAGVRGWPIAAPALAGGAALAGAALAAGAGDAARTRGGGLLGPLPIRRRDVHHHPRSGGPLAAAARRQHHPHRSRSAGATRRRRGDCARVQPGQQRADGRGTDRRAAPGRSRGAGAAGAGGGAGGEPRPGRDPLRLARHPPLAGDRPPEGGDHHGRGLHEGRGARRAAGPPGRDARALGGAPLGTKGDTCGQARLWQVFACTWAVPQAGCVSCSGTLLTPWRAWHHSAKAIAPCR